MLEVVLLLNTLWFAMGFYVFYFRRSVFAKVMVPNRDHRDNDAYAALIETGRFMGGFNLALSLFNLGLVFNLGGLNADSQWAIILIFNALAHVSQFAGNVPMALQNRRGGGLWNVFTGVMLQIFVIDLVLTIFNGGLAIALLL
ncbi:MAG: hypothetical protein AAF439_09410 [Pseudomonadota bacterium]